MKPAQYWRENKTWSHWVGRRGIVVASTYVRVASPQQVMMTPYSLVLVDFGDQKKTFMGEGHHHFQPKDAVVCMLKKIAEGDNKELIEYGIKVSHVRS